MKRKWYDYLISYTFAKETIRPAPGNMIGRKIPFPLMKKRTP